MLPSLLLSAVMCLISYGMQYVIEGTLLTLIVQILVGVAVYAGLSWLFRLEAFFVPVPHFRNHKTVGRVVLSLLFRPDIVE
uniref:hypothetical protein n=1 Tax=Clostridium sp. NkU-1 TaxID=1095009 RepID=UPI000A429D7D